MPSRLSLKTWYCGATVEPVIVYLGLNKNRKKCSKHYILKVMQQSQFLNFRGAPNCYLLLFFKILFNRHTNIKTYLHTYIHSEYVYTYVYQVCMFTYIHVHMYMECFFFFFFCYYFSSASVIGAAIILISNTTWSCQTKINKTK